MKRAAGRIASVLFALTLGAKPAISAVQTTGRLARHLTECIRALAISGPGCATGFALTPKKVTGGHVQFGSVTGWVQPDGNLRMVFGPQTEGGTLVVPVLINDAITLTFIIDSGAADVSIPADVFLTLMRAGTVDKSDFIGSRTYELADGSTVPSPIFCIRSLKVGNLEIEKRNRQHRERKERVAPRAV
jgi:hypothetical protein